jgi:hypothetical protein
MQSACKALHTASRTESVCFCLVVLAALSSKSLEFWECHVRLVRTLLDMPLELVLLLYA